MSFFSHELRQRLLEVGEQDPADDPRVIAIFQTPRADLTYYIISYDPMEDRYFGYLKREGINDWGFIPRQEIDKLYEIMQWLPAEDQVHVLLKGEPPISQLVPELKNDIAAIRIDRLKQEQEKKKGKDQGQEPER
ncbi:MAG: hypothetical protein RLP14_08300 [Owenweeksia sp.]